MYRYPFNEVALKGRPMEPNKSFSSSAQAPFEAENVKAEELISAGDLSAAARILVDIVEKDPNNWRAFNNMGIVSWMQQAWGDAFVMFRKSISLKPDYSDAIMNLFDAALKLRRANEILPDLRKALEANGGLEEVKVLVETIEQEGDEIYRSERALVVGVHNPLIEQANTLLEDGRINEAMAKYLEANDTQGPSAEAFSGLGIVSYYQGRYGDAFTLFVEALKINPADPDTYVNLLDAAKNCDRVDEAKKIYETFAKAISSLKPLASEFEKAL